MSFDASLIERAVYHLEVEVYDDVLEARGEVVYVVFFLFEVFDFDDFFDCAVHVSDGFLVYVGKFAHVAFERAADVVGVEQDVVAPDAHLDDVLEHREVLSQVGNYEASSLILGHFKG